MSRRFDVVGVGLNATDTVLLVSRFPGLGGKTPFAKEVLSPGGQVASALAACQKLGLRTKYIGSVGDDERGRIQMESLAGSGNRHRACADARELSQSVGLHHRR